MNTIGTKIRHRRKLMALSQQQLAKRSGVTQSMISRLENTDTSIPLDCFISIINTLSLDITDVVPNVSKEKMTKTMDELDVARTNRDFEKIKQILNRHPVTFWNKCPELQIYRSWHDAILNYHDGEHDTAIRKIKRLIHHYQGIPACYEIMAQVLNNYGNIQTDVKQKARSYNNAKKLYQQSEQLNFQTYINILVNLGNTFCQLEKYKHSLRHVKEAYALLHEHNSTYHLTNLTIVECNAHYFQKNYDQCMDILLGARTLFEHSDQLILWQKYKELFTSE